MAGRVLGALGALLGSLAHFGGHFFWSLSEDERKMGEGGCKLRARCAMIAPRLPCWGEFGSFWEGPGALLVTFFAIFGKMAEV